MDAGKIIFEELNKCVYNETNEAGEKLHVIDASDLPKIIPEIVKKLNEPEAQIETPNINNNEGKRECCSHPEKYRFVDKEGYLRCSNCHGYIE